MNKIVLYFSLCFVFISCNENLKNTSVTIVEPEILKKVKPNKPFYYFGEFEEIDSTLVKKYFQTEDFKFEDYEYSFHSDTTFAINKLYDLVILNIGDGICLHYYGYIFNKKHKVTSTMFLGADCDAEQNGENYKVEIYDIIDKNTIEIKEGFSNSDTDEEMLGILSDKIYDISEGSFKLDSVLISKRIDF